MLWNSGEFEFWDDLEYIHYIYVLNLSTHGEVLELILKQVCISSESSLCKTNYENRKSDSMKTIKID